MARTPSEFAVHVLMEGGHREEVRFSTIQEFQQWYGNELVPRTDSKEFITVPMKTVQGEYMLIRPSSILALRVEPIFSSSVEHY
jgi:hypothetical protein